MGGKEKDLVAKKGTAATDKKKTKDKADYEKLYQKEVKGKPAEVTIPTPQPKKTAVGDTTKALVKAKKPAVKLVATEAEKALKATKGGGCEDAGDGEEWGGSKDGEDGMGKIRSAR